MIFSRPTASSTSAHGVFALYSSVAARNGNFDGYFKVFFDHLQVFQWEKDKKKDALEIFWQAIVGTLAASFKNHPHDQLAARVPFSGSYRGEKIGVWRAVATILKNAFVSALVPNVDQKITIDQVKRTRRGKNPSFRRHSGPDGWPALSSYTNKGSIQIILHENASGIPPTKPGSARIAGPQLRPFGAPLLWRGASAFDRSFTVTCTMLAAEKLTGGLDPMPDNRASTMSAGGCQ